MIVFVLGLQGVGKTAVVEELSKRLEDWEVINFGDVVQEILKGDRDEFRRSANLKNFKEIQIKAAQKIFEYSKKKNVILTSHALLYRKDGFYPGFPEYLLKILKPTAIYMITAKPEEIYDRRFRNEEGRTRDRTPPDLIKLEQDLSIQAVISYACQSGSVFYLIENPEGKLNETVEKLYSLIKNLKK